MRRPSGGSRGGFKSGRRAEGRDEARPSKGKSRCVVGIHSCLEAISVRPEAISEVWLSEGWERSQQLEPFADFTSKKRVALKTVALKRLDELSRGHQGVAVFVDSAPVFTWDLLVGDDPKCVVLLDGIEDPQNLGAMMRTAWLMGVAAMFIPADRAAGLTPSVCKVASGGAEHVPVEVTNNFATVITKLKELGFWVYALTENESESVYKLQLAKKTAWIIGSEDKGIRKAIVRDADVAVRIPQVETGSSYNATVALAIALSETVRTNMPS